MRADWRRVRDLFERALEEQPADLEAWLERQPADSADVRAEVRSLLEHYSHAGEFLNRPVGERVPALLDEEPSYQSGQVIGPYTIVRELGRGGMGRVYLANDSRLGRAVALKALAPQLTSNPSQRERLRREARAAAGVSHPGVCTIYALEEYDNELFIVAEHVDGRTLREEIETGARPGATETLRAAREIADALAAAHAKSVIHRDLKPENVMRTGQGRLKILDFGLARMTAVIDEPAVQVTEPGVLVGTPGYMAPEQLRGDRGDARVDVFAYGVMMYEYACGTHPFAAPSTLAIAGRILHSDATPLQTLCPELPLPLAAVIERCLRKDPVERWASGGAIAAALAGSGSAAPGPVVRWWRTHQAVAIGLYFLASTVAWQIKDWHAGTATTALFGMIGVAATAAGVFRGHLLFTERMNRGALDGERRRAEAVTLFVDLLITGALLADAALAAPERALAAVLTAGLAVGIGLARLVVERSTAAAAFRS